MTIADPRVYDFDECLSWSHKQSSLPIWEEIYRDYFSDFESMICHLGDGEHQRAGIDRSIILSNSKQILVDEKARGRNRITNKVYEDIALEYESHTDRHGAPMPGWVVRPLRADYICYAIIPIGVGYMLPVRELQAAYRRRRDLWHNLAERRERGFKIIRSRNEGYVTKSLCISPGLLLGEIMVGHRVLFDPISDYGFNNVGASPP